MKTAILASALGVLTLHPAAAGPICDVKNYGARGDGIVKDTAAIQAAINDCGKTRGRVWLHDGVFLSGMIRMASGIELRIESTATLKGTQDDNDYPRTSPPTDNSQLAQCRKTLIYGERVHGVTIDGGGTVDGSGGNPLWKGKEETRPMAIYFALSSEIALHDFKVRDAGMWSTVMLETDNVTIQRLDIHTPYGPTRDGIDVVDGHHVLIEDNTILSEDDSICLKSGTSRGVYDVVVRNNHILKSSVANGLKLGTASKGSFKKIKFSHNVIGTVDKAAMAVESVDGATIDDVEFSNITFEKAGTAAFVLLGQRLGGKSVGSISHIRFTDIQGQTQHTWGSAISGTRIGDMTYSPEHILFKNVSVTEIPALTSVPAIPPEYAGQYPDPNLWGDLPAFSYFVRHAKDVTFEGCTDQSRDRDARAARMEVDVQ